MGTFAHIFHCEPGAEDFIKQMQAACEVHAYNLVYITIISAYICSYIIYTYKFMSNNKTIYVAPWQSGG